MNNLNSAIEQEIKNFLQDYSRVQKSKTNWELPLVGFAAADDPLFRELKQVVSPSHAMPGDLLDNARTVIVYFIPFDRSVAMKNKHQGQVAAEWAIAYIETNQLIVAMNQHLADFLLKQNFNTVVLPPTHNFDKERLISDWSHRHIAYIAGLGKFGVHNLLITEKGCCGRLGSIVTDAKITADKRPESEFCLYKHNQTCQKCVKKCATGALQTDAFDRHKCYSALLANAEFYTENELADVCGKCTSAVPCSFINPVKKLKK